MSNSLPTSSNAILDSSIGTTVQAGVVSGGIHVHSSPTPPVIPRQLPPPPAHFIGRSSEIAEIDKAASGETSQLRPRIVVISGPGGVGKTAVALHWLYKNLQRFSDGHLYANLRSAESSRPISVTQVLSAFLRSLGVSPDHIPLDLAEQTALYRSVTAGKSLSLFLDDAESAAQVRPLIPISPTSVVVVASHWRLGSLSLDGARFVAVEALDESTALRLLSLIVGRDRTNLELSSSRRLVQLCGGLPIALAVAAARLCTRPQWPVSRIVDIMTDARRRIGSLAITGEPSVQSSFDLSYSELAPEAARLYRLLSLHPGADFASQVAAAMGNTSLQDADDLLADLVDANLLQEISDDRFQFHDLLRLHAKQHVEQKETDAERSDALRRMAAWYLTSAVTADLVVMPLRQRLGSAYGSMSKTEPPFINPSSALQWLERELSNLIAVQRCSYEHKWWNLAWELCEALWGILLYRKFFPQWFQTHDLGVQAAQKSGNRVAQSRILIQRGIAHLTLEHFVKAGEDFGEALRLSREARSEASEATALEHLGLVARKVDTVEAAIDYFAQALSITRRLGEHRGTVLHLRRLGETLFEAGRKTEAVRYLEEAVAAASDLGDQVLLARSLTRLGTAHVRLGKTDSAAEFLRSAEEILTTAGSYHYLAEAVEASAELHIQINDLPAARKSLKQAIELYRRSEMPRAEQVQRHLLAISDESSTSDEEK